MKWSVLVAVVAMALCSTALADQADIAARKYNTDAKQSEVDGFAKLARDVTTILQAKGYSVTVDDLNYVSPMGMYIAISYGDLLSAQLKPNPMRLFVAPDPISAGICYDLATGAQQKVPLNYNCFN